MAKTPPPSDNTNYDLSNPDDVDRLVQAALASIASAAKGIQDPYKDKTVQKATQKFLKDLDTVLSLKNIKGKVNLRKSLRDFIKKHGKAPNVGFGPRELKIISQALIAAKPPRELTPEEIKSLVGASYGPAEEFLTSEIERERKRQSEYSKQIREYGEKFFRNILEPGLAKAEQAYEHAAAQAAADIGGIASNLFGGGASPAAYDVGKFGSIGITTLRSLQASQVGFGQALKAIFHNDLLNRETMFKTASDEVIAGLLGKKAELETQKGKDILQLTLQERRDSATARREYSQFLIQVQGMIAEDARRKAELGLIAKEKAVSIWQAYWNARQDFAQIFGYDPETGALTSNERWNRIQAQAKKIELLTDMIRAANDTIKDKAYIAQQAAQLGMDIKDYQLRVAEFRQSVYEFEQRLELERARLAIDQQRLALDIAAASAPQFTETPEGVIMTRYNPRTGRIEVTRTKYAFMPKFYFDSQTGNYYYFTGQVDAKGRPTVISGFAGTPGTLAMDPEVKAAVVKDFNFFKNYGALFKKGSLMTPDQIQDAAKTIASSVNEGKTEGKNIVSPRFVVKALSDPYVMLYFKQHPKNKFVSDRERQEALLKWAKVPKAIRDKIERQFGKNGGRLLASIYEEADKLDIEGGPVDLNDMRIYITEVYQSPVKAAFVESLFGIKFKDTPHGHIAVVKGSLYDPARNPSAFYAERTFPDGTRVREVVLGGTRFPVAVLSDRRTTPQTKSSTILTKGVTGSGYLVEAFYDPEGQFNNGAYSPQGIGGHKNHVHLSITDPQAMLLAIQTARKFGLAVTENPYVGPVHGGHVTDSYHYRTFPGKYNGKSLGMAIDVSGDPAKMRAFFWWAVRNLGGKAGQRIP
jgi:hypothetical protein